MNPPLDYEVIDLPSSDLSLRVDIAAPVEALEHIPPDDLPAFIYSIGDVLTGDGRFVLPVSHENKPVKNTHDRHFSATVLKSLLTPRVEIVNFVPFDRQSKVFTAFELKLGSRGRHFVVNSPPIVDTLWNLYQRRYLYADLESDCGRIAAVCQR